MNNGKYALIDLYFPQLNIGVECDEEYHLSKKKEDVLRELSIEEKLSSIIKTSDFELYRINAYDSLESIDKQINNVVEMVRDKINKSQFESWTGINGTTQLAIEKGTISTTDNFNFKTIVERDM